MRAKDSVLVGLNYVEQMNEKISISIIDWKNCLVKEKLINNV